MFVSFETHPDRYRHWRLDIAGRVATLSMKVDEDGGLDPAYPLKLNSYDLGVDIELYDAVQRLRFEHPEVAAVVITSGLDKIFSAGANIRVLAASSHAAKVNFCKFTNETRNAIEDASAHSGQRYVAAVNGTASGGGYELALACDHIVLVDDNASAVSLPEVALLAVLPGTGGLTRLVDKRQVRRDRADILSTTAEGVRGRRAVEWGLVDELAPRSRWDDAVRARAEGMAAVSDRPDSGPGVELSPLTRQMEADSVRYPSVTATLDRERGVVEITVHGPEGAQPKSPDELLQAGADSWLLGTARALDDLILHLRANELELGTWLLRTTGDATAVLAAEDVLTRHADHWLVREIVLYWKRTLKRLDVTSRSLLALIEPGSCFAGTLFELALAADRSYLHEGGEPPTRVALSAMNFGPLTMGNDLTRLAGRFLGQTGHVEELATNIGVGLEAQDADKLGLVTAVLDDIDWDDEVRLAIEERVSFSPDALTGMEASLRFAGPETLETKIFGRLTAWQNWIFQRPNATGEDGALRRYGTGHRAEFDTRRV
ncbi:MAG: 2,3-epoxybenzoyl-CoA dihydrolase [Acidimicrobiales bacterium]